MLNPHPRAMSTMRPGFHPSGALSRHDVHTEPGTLVQGVGAPQGAASNKGIWHPGTRRSRQVTNTLRSVELCPLAPGEETGAERAPLAPSSGADTRSRCTPSKHSKDTATALQWLREGAPIEDARTVIEVRRRFELSPELARRYATNIVRAAAKELRTKRFNSSREEIIHAVA
jgi:hypothetical protein